MIASVLLLAVLAAAQRPVTKRPVARPVDPRTVAAPGVVPPVVVQTPAAQGAHLLTFQGTWLGPGTDSTARRMIRVDGLHIRVSESCLAGGDVECNYEGDAVAYRPLGAAPNDSTISALGVEYGDARWRQSLILRPSEQGRLDAFVYTRYAEAERRNAYEHQSLTRVAFQTIPA